MATMESFVHGTMKVSVSHPTCTNSFAVAAFAAVRPTCTTVLPADVVRDVWAPPPLPPDEEEATLQDMFRNASAPPHNLVAPPSALLAHAQASTAPSRKVTGMATPAQAVRVINMLARARVPGQPGTSALHLLVSRLVRARALQIDWDLLAWVAADRRDKDTTVLQQNLRHAAARTVAWMFHTLEGAEVTGMSGTVRVVDMRQELRDTARVAAAAAADEEHAMTYKRAREHEGRSHEEGLAAADRARAAFLDRATDLALHAAHTGAHAPTVPAHPIALLFTHGTVPGAPRHTLSHPVIMRADWYAPHGHRTYHTVLSEGDATPPPDLEVQAHLARWAEGPTPAAAAFLDPVCAAQGIVGPEGGVRAVHTRGTFRGFEDEERVYGEAGPIDREGGSAWHTFRAWPQEADDAVMAGAKGHNALPPLALPRTPLRATAAAAPDVMVVPGGPWWGRAPHGDADALVPPHMTHHRNFTPAVFRGEPRQIAQWLSVLARCHRDLLHVPSLDNVETTSHMMWLEGTDADWHRPFMLQWQEALTNTLGGGTARFTAWVLAFRTRTGEVHGNALVWDRMGRGEGRPSLIRYEPRGTHPTTYDHGVLDAVLTRFAKDHGGTYVSPFAYQRVLGCQALEVHQAMDGMASLPSHGPCVTWSLFLIHLRLLFPDEAFKSLTRRLHGTAVTPTLLIQAYGHMLDAAIREEFGAAASTWGPQPTARQGAAGAYGGDEGGAHGFAGLVNAVRARALAAVQTVSPLDAGRITLRAARRERERNRERGQGTSTHTSNLFAEVPPAVLARAQAAAAAHGTVGAEAMETLTARVEEAAAHLEAEEEAQEELRVMLNTPMPPTSLNPDVQRALQRVWMDTNSLAAFRSTHLHPVTIRVASFPDVRLTWRPMADAPDNVTFMAERVSESMSSVDAVDPRVLALATGAPTLDSTALRQFVHQMYDGRLRLEGAPTFAAAVRRAEGELRSSPTEHVVAALLAHTERPESAGAALPPDARTALPAVDHLEEVRRRLAADAEGDVMDTMLPLEARADAAARLLRRPLVTLVLRATTRQVQPAFTGVGRPASHVMFEPLVPAATTIDIVTTVHVPVAEGEGERGAHERLEDAFIAHTTLPMLVVLYGGPDVRGVVEEPAYFVARWKSLPDAVPFIPVEPPYM